MNVSNNTLEIKQVDSYRFLDRVTKKMVQSWIRLAEPCPIPWTPLSRPLEECTVALLSSAGLALNTDRPFDRSHLLAMAARKR